MPVTDVWCRGSALEARVHDEDHTANRSETSTHHDESWNGSSARRGRDDDAAHENDAAHERRLRSSLRDLRAHSALLIVSAFIDSVRAVLSERSYQSGLIRAVLSERRYTANGMRCSERDAVQRIRRQQMQRVGENHDGQAERVYPALQHVILHCSVASGLVDGAIGPVDEPIGPVDEPIPSALHATMRFYMPPCATCQDAAIYRADEAARPDAEVVNRVGRRLPG